MLESIAWVCGPTPIFVFRELRRSLGGGHPNPTTFSARSFRSRAFSMRVAIVSGAALRSLAVLGTRQGKVRGLASLVGASCLRCVFYGWAGRSS